jgi:hypothetical protein
VVASRNQYTLLKYFNPLSMIKGLLKAVSVNPFFIFNPKYAIDNLLRAEIASKSATLLLFSISP